MFTGPPIYHQTHATQRVCTIDDMDARAAIYAHAFVPTNVPQWDVVNRVFDTVLERRQLFAINGRPC